MVVQFVLVGAVAEETARRRVSALRSARNRRDCAARAHRREAPPLPGRGIVPRNRMRSKLDAT